MKTESGMELGRESIGARLLRAAKCWALAPERTSDEDLMEAAAGGDEGAFEELFARYELELYRYCLGYLRRADQSRELVREVSVRTRRRAGRFGRCNDFRTWLFGTAQILCIREILRERAQEGRALREIA